MYKTKSFYTILFISALLFCFGTFSEAKVINFDPTDAIPQITGSGSYEVEQEISSGKKRWAVPYGPKVSVTISVSASGFGYGQGTFSPVTIVGETIREYADPVIDVGSMTRTGSWWHGTNTIKTVISRRVPSVHKKSYPWSAEGKIVLTPTAWKVSVTEGGGIRWPLQIQGTFNITGTWEGQDNKKIPRWAPSGTQGSHDRKLTYYCGSCLQKGDTPESIGGKAAHAIVTCKRDGCGKQYRACNPVAARKHSSAGSGRWYCDPFTVSFNKTSFLSDEVLNVTVEGEGLSSAVVQVGSLDPKSQDGPDTISIYSTFNGLDFSQSDVLSVSVPVTVNYKSNGSSFSKIIGEYITVEKAPSITLNRTVLTVYQTLGVTVTKSDLYYVDMTINGDSVPGKYASGNTSLTLVKGFDYDDAGSHDVVINIYYGENGEQSITRYKYITVLADQ